LSHTGVIVARRSGKHSCERLRRANAAGTLRI
jgi:hypothetical protein